MVLPREANKVSFSPEHELIQFNRSIEKKIRIKRTSDLGDNNLSIENVDKAGWKNGKVDGSVRVTQLREKLSINGILDGHGRVTRSRRKKLVESLAREKSRGEDNVIAARTRKSLENIGVVLRGIMRKCGKFF